MFAKIYESDTYGQILVQKDTNGTGAPCIKFSVEPKDFGVCSTSLNYKDDDDGWDLQESNFLKCDIDFAEKAVSPIFDAVSGGLK